MDKENLKKSYILLARPTNFIIINKYSEFLFYE